MKYLTYVVPNKKKKTWTTKNPCEPRQQTSPMNLPWGDNPRNIRLYYESEPTFQKERNEPHLEARVNHDQGWLERVPIHINVQETNIDVTLILLHESMHIENSTQTQTGYSQVSLTGAVIDLCIRQYNIVHP